MTGAATPHRRRNLLTGDWVLVSPQRTQRPWQGEVAGTPAGSALTHDPGCYLCPGNTRSGGVRNPDYRGPFAFDNDFPALTRESAAGDDADALFVAEAETGYCRVICFSERHDRHLVDMDAAEVASVLRFVAAECRSLAEMGDVAYVQAFENRGSMMGCSNPHPHGQVWATSTIPDEPRKEFECQRTYHELHGRPLLLDYVGAELQRQQRIVARNEHAASLVPYWAIWPFETLLVPLAPAAALDALPDDSLQGFASVLHQTLQAYDRLFDTPMPYSMGFHPQPADGAAHAEWQLHAHFYPPLLRSATIRKHMVGFEMLAMPQRDLTPEAAAERLRSALRR